MNDLSENYTKHIRKELKRLSSLDQTVDDNAPEICDFFNNPNNFRPFSDGLTELMSNYGPDIASVDLTSPDAKADYLFRRLTAINGSVAKATVKSWFTGKRPQSNSKSRTLMYQVCFALQVSLEGVQWFFQHIYYERSFNCHSIEEAIYYFCFYNHLPYEAAQALLVKYNESSPEPLSDDLEPLYTSTIQAKLEELSTLEELDRFLSENRQQFHFWHVAAKDCISSLLEAIKGTPESLALFEQYKKNLALAKAHFDEFGLLFQELIVCSADSNDLKAATANRSFSGDERNFSLNDFMLNRIFDTDIVNMSKTVPILPVIRSNFPSVTTLKNHIRTIESCTSYDSIRKCLILLHFYYFWCSQKLQNKITEYDSSLFEEYCSNLNFSLTTCCYDPLCEANPYDALFIYCAQNPNPLDCFRALYINFVDEDPDSLN